MAPKPSRIKLMDDNL